jgi:hypothetical protein
MSLEFVLALYAYHIYQSSHCRSLAKFQATTLELWFLGYSTQPNRRVRRGLSCRSMAAGP